MDENKCPYLEKNKTYINFKIEYFKLVWQNNFQETIEYNKQTFELYKMLVKYLFVLHGSAAIALLYNLSKFEKIGAEKIIYFFIAGAVFTLISLAFMLSAHLTLDKHRQELSQKALKDDGNKIIDNIFDIKQKVNENKNNPWELYGVPIIKLPIFSLVISYIFIVASIFSLIGGTDRFLSVYGMSLFDKFF